MAGISFSKIWFKGKNVENQGDFANWYSMILKKRIIGIVRNDKNKQKW